ncbi:hypothetical protein [Bradyrhizobium sp. SZCCHNS2096]|uniref:hypothetical protein n=1 Tax=Bradyrhizobium sp. SZCCHNS2096 TaxID=3057309 RepID=UPI00291634DA|nr:hypothetical protein [Bradyrhizobium sp. SZCCHNS2096]
MKSTSSRASKYTEGVDGSSYGAIAREYYDESRHPTCADFRSAARIFLQKLFKREQPYGRVADVGCGKSLISEFGLRDLVLIDEAEEMLALNSGEFEKRLVNVEKEAIGHSEFDWIFAILGDPYNSLNSWLNIANALRAGGRCFFIVPSLAWARKFREQNSRELSGFARFDVNGGKAIFLRSLIFERSEQQAIIERAGLTVAGYDTISVRELAVVKSPKIFNILSDGEALLEIYQARK